MEYLLLCSDIAFGPFAVLVMDDVTNIANIPQRQTVVSQFFQLDRLVVEGGKTVRDHPAVEP